MSTQSPFRSISQFGLFLFALSLPISHVPAEFGIGIAVLGWIGESLLAVKWRMSWHPIFAPLMMYLAWNLISAGLSERPLHSLAAVGDNEWPLLIKLMLFWLVEDEVLLKQLLYVFLSASAIAIVYSLWQVVGGYEFYRGKTLDPMGWGFYRSVGFYSFYLTFAAFAMSVFFLASGLSVELKNWKATVLAGLSFLAVLATFARSMWLSFVAAIPIFAFTRGKKVGVVVSSIFLILVVGGTLAVPALRYRAESIVEPDKNETRLNLWKTAVRVSEHNPIFGVGEDNWDLVFERYRVGGFYDTTVHPHNDYLTILVSSGVPGLLSFLSIWGILLWRGFKVARLARSPMVRAVALGSTFSLLGLLIGGMFQNYYGTFINCLEWWFVAGLLVTADKLSQLADQTNVSS
jgi:hypothetical protein